MSTKYTTLLLLAGALMLSACEKVIQVDLESSEPQTVIEAVLVEGEPEFEITLSKSSDYFNPEAPVPITGATAQLLDDQGNSWALQDQGNGTYTATVVAEAGRTYTLEVEAAGETHVAQSEMRAVVPLVDVEFVFGEDNGFLDAGYSVFLRFQDSANAENFYRIRHGVNGVPEDSGEDLIVFDDNFFDGNFARVPLQGRRFESGDQLDLELVHFDEGSFDYWNTVSAIVSTEGGGGGEVAAPGNPITNWSNGALGVFSCEAKDNTQVTIP